MPRLAKIDGVLIRMYFVEHPPPHFHVAYQDRICRFDIETLEQLPTDKHRAAPVVRRLVREWAHDRQDYLRSLWRELAERARDKQE